MLRLVVALAIPTLAASSALAQGNWDKTYNVSSKPSLQLTIGNEPVHVESCGGCRSVRIRVDWHGQDPSRWHLTEMQGGNSIHFELKQKELAWLQGGWQGRSPEVTVDAPTATDLDLHAGNGAVNVAGLHGALDLKTGNGGIQTDDTAGALRLQTGNGAVQVRHAEGTFTSGNGNGAISVEGRFSQVDLHTGNGVVSLSLLPGSQLQSSSRLTTGNGHVTLRLPRDLRAELDINTGNGGISNSLAMTGQPNSDRQHLHGALNGGGPTLHLQTGNGGVSLSD